MNSQLYVGTRQAAARPEPRLLLICGMLSSVLYVLMNVVAALLYTGYNSLSQTVSELSAIGAPTRPLWVALGTVYQVLATAFAWGVLRAAKDNRALHTAGILLFVYGLVGFFWPLAPMHQRAVLQAGGGTLSDIMHIAFSIVTIPLMMLALSFGAAAFDRRFRLYSIASLVLLIIFGTYTGIDGPKVNANLPTPWLGLIERALIGVYLLWIVVLAIILLQRDKIEVIIHLTRSGKIGIAERVKIEAPQLN